MPRFVILAHDWPAPHWDLLLEAGQVLKAWRLLAEPVPGRAVPAEPNFDHRPVYLDYEGPLGGGRGAGAQWDAGTYEGSPAGGEWTLTLAGGRLSGPVILRRTGTGWVFETGPRT